MTDLTPIIAHCRLRQLEWEKAARKSKGGWRACRNMERAEAASRLAEALARSSTHAPELADEITALLRETGRTHE